MKTQDVTQTFATYSAIVTSVHNLINTFHLKTVPYTHILQGSTLTRKVKWLWPTKHLPQLLGTMEWPQASGRKGGKTMVMVSPTTVINKHNYFQRSNHHDLFQQAYRLCGEAKVRKKWKMSVICSQATDNKQHENTALDDLNAGYKLHTFSSFNGENASCWLLCISWQALQDAFCERFPG